MNKEANQSLIVRVGKNIKLIRTASRLSLEELSWKTAKFHPRWRRVSIAQISRIENGIAPHLIQLIPIADALQVSVTDLLFMDVKEVKMTIVLR